MQLHRRPCPTDGVTVEFGLFDRIVARMQTMKPDITAANVRIDYSGSGLGFAGDPNGMEIAPLVTVRLTGMQFVPLTGFMFATLNMPGFSTTMPAEDSSRKSIELG